MKNQNWDRLIAFFATISAWVAGPIIVALFIGNWLDRQYTIAPWGLLAAIGSAFIISNIGLVKESKKLLNKIDQEYKENKSLSHLLETEPDKKNNIHGHHRN